MKNAMILAAGRGERLKPITDIQPKALCKINNIPVLEHHLLNLEKAEFEKVIINHAYLGFKIRQHVKSIKNLSLQIIFSPEPPGGLETGGGIFQALPHFGEEPFTVINADIYSDYDLKMLKLPKNSLGHLVLVEKNSMHNGDFGINENNKYLKNDNKTHIFTGIACYSPKLFSNCKIGRYSITPILRNKTDQNKITGEVYSGSWFDIGTISQLENVCKNT